jgi:hypothetical protein
MRTYHLMGILISKRNACAHTVQDILTKHGCIIRVRLGLHDGIGDSCTEEGLVILQLAGEIDEINALRDELNAVTGVTAEALKLEAK